jgi:hypothetical protein
MHWTIQATTNFTDWMNLSEVSNTPDEMEFSDTESIHQPHRFYRVAATAP